MNHSFEGKISKFNLSVDALNLTGKTTVGSKSYTIKVDRIGKFEISAIYEVKTGDLGKIIPSRAEIVKCPEAKWRKIGGMDVCQDSIGDVDVILKGIPPLSVWILKAYSSSSPVIDLVSIGSVEDGYGTFSTVVKIPVQKLNNVKLKILRVADGKLNTIDYDDEFKSSLPQITTKSSYHLMESLSEFLISARPLPKVQFSECKSSQKLKVDERNSILRLALKLSGNAPFKIQYKRQVDTELKTESFDYDIETDFIEADTPGTYLLDSIHDSFCQGIILEPSSCNVIATFPPTISIASTPIESACVGAIGLTANLSFTGDPPFWVDVQQELLDTNVKKIERYKNLKTRHLMRFEPSDGNGTYRYSFLKVRELSNFQIGDSVYSEGIPLNLAPITQVVHAFPSAFIRRGSQQQTKCVNDSAHIAVALEGSGPWSLTYEIMHDQYKKQYTMGDIVNQKINIVTPPLTKSGLHIFSLTGTNITSNFIRNY
jgi:nucleoporin POM152